MKIKFLGCGAADFDWSCYGEDGVLGSTVTLLNDHILLDCGPTAIASMARFGVDKEDIRAIVNTHSHNDHLNLSEVEKVSGKRKIDYYGSLESCRLLEGICTVHPLTFGDVFEVENISFLALPANHMVENIREETFNYLVTFAGKTLLYALDTAWMTTRARYLIGKSHIDAIIWDGTMAEPDNWRIFEHSDTEMFSRIRRVLQADGNIDDQVKIYLDHRSKMLWPQDVAAQEAIARREKVNLAHEGETVII